VAIEVEIYEKIRYLHEREGLSQRKIATLLGVSRNTVKRYFDGANVPWERQGTSGRSRYVATDKVLEFVKSCLAEDETENIKKQKHTAKRIYDRLVAEKDFSGGESTIRKIVAELKAKQSKVFIPLSYDPAEAIQVDWGEGTCTLEAKRQRSICGVCGSVTVQICSAKHFTGRTRKAFLKDKSAGLNSLVVLLIR
jgi:transposase